MKSSIESKKRQIRLIKDRNLPRDEFMAACVGDTKWLHYSLRDGHSPNLFDKDGLAPIHLAALHGKLDCLKLLVENYDVDVNVVSKTGHCPLMLAINKKNGPAALQCMKYLLDQGADLECANRDGETVVHQAAAEGLEDCLRFLLERGADADLKNIRDKTAHDLAKIWGQRICARMVQKKVWDHEKDYSAIERMKLLQMQREFQMLQQEALHQIMNEHDFFGNVSFNNWMEQKGYKGDYNQANMFTNKRQSDSLLGGLVSRLFANGTLKDIANRLEKLLQAYIRAAELKAISASKPNLMKFAMPKKLKAKGYGRSLDEKKQQQFPTNIPFLFGSPGKKMLDGPRLDSNYQLFGRLDQLSRFKPTGIYAVQTRDQDAYAETSDGLFKKAISWNYSTNLNSFPVTDISHPISVSISTLPDIDEEVLKAPGLANISFEITKKTDRIIVKLQNSSQQVETIEVPITTVAPDFIEAAVDSLPFGRRGSRFTNTMFEFKCVHLFDIQRKKTFSSVHLSEIVVHLKSVLDGYLFGCRITNGGGKR